MTSTGLLFATVFMASCIGLVASLAKPVWFRFNGAVPRRWKIGVMWLVLAAICALGTLGQSNIRLVGGTETTEPVTSTESAPDILIERFPGQAVTTEQIDVPMDAAKPADENTEIVTDVTPPPPLLQLPTPPSPTRRQSQK